VTEVQGKFLVAVVGSDNAVELRPVTPAERVGALWVIDKGLKPGDRVVVEGVQKVKTGVRVNATQAAAEGEATPATAPPSPPRARRSRPGMAKFFINRPIVAMVIAILMVIVAPSP